MDAFCGSGSVGVEALSRGGAGRVFVDLSPDACAVAARNAETCGFADKYETCPRDVLLALNDEALRGPGLDLLTLTPPYEEIDYDELMASVAASPLLNADCVVVVEYPVERGKPPFRIGELVGVRNRRYGRTALAFYAFKHGARSRRTPRPDDEESTSRRCPAAPPRVRSTRRHSRANPGHRTCNNPILIPVRSPLGASTPSELSCPGYVGRRTSTAPGTSSPRAAAAACPRP